MHRRQFLQAPALVELALAPAVAATGESLDAQLRPYLSRYDLPAVAAAVVRRGDVIAAGAAGTRRAGTDTPVTLRDRFHIGSDTKAMTALLAGMFVEAGKLRWDSTVGEQFPELSATISRGLGAVTLPQLLSHTSGMPNDNATFTKLVLQSYGENGNLDDVRAWLVRQWCTQPLVATPGTTFAYSNMGFVMVGAILERLGGKTWEELIVEHVFTPLGLRTAGFGPQSSMGLVDAPLGHAVQQDGTLKPMLAGPNGDNPLILGPAGTVHLSILDFAAWAGWNAAEGRRGPNLVRPETMRKLHTKVISIAVPGAPPGTPAEGGYGLGWGVTKLPFASEPVITHAGSNTMNLASIVLQPAEDFAMVLATNVGGTRADPALRALTEELFRQFGPAR